jgi:two-component system, LuxR family, sensor kinase FixL
MKRHWVRPFFRRVQRSRSAVLALAGVFIAIIATVDWRLDVNISFGFLYLFPMLMVGSCLSRWQIAFVAALCTALDEAFDNFPWSTSVGIPRVILTFAAFCGAGLYVYQSARSRTQTARHFRELMRESELRRQAEEQLEFLVATSPATIFTLDTAGKVILANDAAHRLLGVQRGELHGQDITRFFPALTSVAPFGEGAPVFRTSMECHGRSQSGDVFLARIWFSTYQTVLGPRLAAVVFDASEDLRDREEFSLQQLLSGSRILIGAVCHEIRNICGAISVVFARLTRGQALSANEDLRALGTLVEGLGHMAGLELRQSATPEIQSTDVRAVIEELRIVIEPAYRDAGMEIRWEIPDRLPRVWADRQALLQACLNLTKNSQRAMERSERKELTIRVVSQGARVVVRIIDTGCGVAEPERLFKPFQEGAEATGLGLYLSRAFVRAFEGDVVYEPCDVGCCFAVVLAAVQPEPAGHPYEEHAENPTVAA